VTRSGSVKCCSLKWRRETWLDWRPVLLNSGTVPRRLLLLLWLLLSAAGVWGPSRAYGPWQIVPGITLQGSGGSTLVRENLGAGRDPRGDHAIINSTRKRRPDPERVLLYIWILSIVADPGIFQGGRVGWSGGGSTLMGFRRSDNLKS